MDKHERVKYDIKNKMWRRRVRNVDHLECLILKDYLFKTSRYNYTSTYINPMITTNQKPSTNTQKLERKEYKLTTKENHQTTKQETKRIKEQRRTTKTTRK